MSHRQDLSDLNRNSKVVVTADAQNTPKLEATQILSSHYGAAIIQQKAIDGRLSGRLELGAWGYMFYLVWSRESQWGADSDF
jgi:hypothetical protein